MRMMLMIIAVCFAIVYSQMNGAVKPANGLAATTIKFMTYNLKFPGFILYVLMTNFYTKKVVNFMNGIKEIDIDMMKMGCKIDYRKACVTSRICVAATIVKIILQFIAYYITEDPTSLKVFIEYVVLNFPLYVVHIIACYWLLCVNLITLHFKYLNDILRSVKYRQCFVIEDFKIKEKLPLFENIKRCGILYDKLCQQSSNISDAFGWQILYILPAAFIIVIHNTFYILRMVRGDEIFSLKFIIIDILYFILFLEFVMPCVICKEESLKFEEILNKVDLILTKDTEDLEEAVSFFLDS